MTTFIVDKVDCIQLILKQVGKANQLKVHQKHVCDIIVIIKTFYMLKVNKTIWRLLNVINKSPTGLLLIGIVRTSPQVSFSDRLKIQIDVGDDFDDDGD